MAIDRNLRASFSSDDFHRFYSGCWVVFEDTVSKITHVDGLGNISLSPLKGGDPRTVSLDLFRDWKALAWPMLGWRNRPRNGGPVYLSRSVNSSGGSLRGIAHSQFKIEHPESLVTLTKVSP